MKEDEMTAIFLLLEMAKEDPRWGTLRRQLGLPWSLKLLGFAKIPIHITYTTLMDAYCKSGKMHRAHDLLQDVLGRGIKPSIVTFNVLMNGFCSAGMLDDGMKLLNWMVDRGIMPNTARHNSLMKQYSIENN
ncbi:hypothetical protein Taro_042029 [Colocasia esculenta]|uniref:Pentatricopeptide repeat-containing protein n=1 Tax=Colocasia esculenta TaxID=4460 RepID=A0A843X1Q7_COLES|nr:hypothetical protein [Colocasia esculenta]